MLYLQLEQGRVVFELAPQFAPRHIDNLRHLVDARFFDGATVNRSQENYVAQWGDAAETEWRDELDQVHFVGSSILNEVVFFHRASRTAIFTDIVQNHDPDGESWWMRWGKDLIE